MYRVFVISKGVMFYEILDDTRTVENAWETSCEVHCTVVAGLFGSTTSGATA